MAENSKK